MKHLSLAVIILASSFAAAQEKPRSGLLSTVFDGKVSGARFIGLGEMGAAAAGGPESSVWNPASLHDISRPILSVDFDVARQSTIDENVLVGDTPLRGRKLTFIGFAAQDAAFFYRPMANFNKHTITDELNPDFNFIDENLKINQFGFSTSSQGDEGATIGLNLSYLNAHRSLAVAASGEAPVIDFADGNGFSLDMGFRQKWTYGAAGLSFFNIPGVLYWNNYKPDQLPVLIRAGTSFYPVPVMGLLFEYDKRFYRNGMDKPSALHLGLELTLATWLQIRGGTYGENLSDPDKTNYATGFSMISPKGGYQIDFALRTYRYDEERVYNYFLSMIFPLPNGSTQEATQKSRARSWNLPK
jgi:hypothetical protein